MLELHPFPLDTLPISADVLDGWKHEIAARQTDQARDAVASRIATQAYHRIASCIDLKHPRLTATEIRDTVESIIAAECRGRMA